MKARTKKLLTRRQSAAYISSRYFEVSPRTLEKSGIPYRCVNGRASYEMSDLDAHAQSMIASSPRRTGSSLTPSEKRLSCKPSNST